ncbi:MAG: hypothetical protein IKH69_04170 [Bacteroidaceae bacterium]|nr:hypothetical protein [Bacteroidaceae bacterium]
MRRLMTYRLIATLLLGWLLVSSSYATNNLRQLFDSLNTEISHKRIFVEQKKQRIDQIKQELLSPDTSLQHRYDVYTKLYNEYRKFVVDSAITYASKSVDMAIAMDKPLLRYRSEFELSILYAMHGMFWQAEDLLKQYQSSDIPPEMRELYYYARSRLLNYYMYTSNRSQELLYQAYMDSLYQSYTDTLSYDYRSTKAQREPNPAKRDIEMRKLMESLPIGSPEYAIAANWVASQESMSQKPDEQKELFIRSAIADIRNAIRETQSLYSLSLICYREGDVTSAFRYAQSSFEDATMAGIQFRIAQVSEFYSTVNEAYQIYEQEVRDRLQRLLILLGVISLCLIISVFYIVRQLRKIMRIRKDLSESNEKLQNLNLALSKANTQLNGNNEELSRYNTLKEQYIAQFFNICSGYIDKIGDYQKSLYKLAINKKYEDLVKSLKSTSVIDDELEELYHHFDIIFLRLYPTFVEDMNALLREEEHIALKPGVLLNKELRIYALLRLGFSDGEQIANFLHCSVSTIYNYKTKMRNKAKGNKEDFDEQVMKIGLTNPRENG